jgi:hypothetical protein
LNWGAKRAGGQRPTPGAGYPGIRVWVGFLGRCHRYLSKQSGIAQRLRRLNNFNHKFNQSLRCMPFPAWELPVSPIAKRDFLLSLDPYIQEYTRGEEENC